MIRKVLAAGATLVAAGSVLVVGGPVSAEPGGGGCHALGSATFTPNGPGAAATFKYTLSGSLDNCTGSRSGAPTRGTIKVGQKVVRWFVVRLSNGTKKTVSATYRAPLATGSGTLPVNSCPAGSTAGIATLTWSGGTTTIVKYTATSVTGGVALQGAVISSVTLRRIGGSTLAPPSIVSKTTNRTYPVGDSAYGGVAFITRSPDACTTTSGLKSVAVEGMVGLGSAD